MLKLRRHPKKGDRLLRTLGDGKVGVKFVNSHLSRHAVLWDGYMKAGAGLIELCVQEEYYHERDYVIYPILFNYRHGLELAMKWIIIFYSGKGFEGVVTKSGDDHNLWELWKKCRKIIEQYVEDDDDKETTDVVEQIVKDFHDLDKPGTNFRYAFGKKGNQIKVPDNMVDVDFENIRHVMEGVSGYFTGLDGWLDDLQSAGL